MTLVGFLLAWLAAGAAGIAACLAVGLTLLFLDAPGAVPAIAGVVAWFVVMFVALPHTFGAVR